MLERFKISGKHVLISGATSGIGLHLVHDFISQGVKVTGLGRNQEKLSELEGLYPDVFKGIRIDLLETESIESVLTDANFMAIDGFVHAAGIIQRRPLNTIKARSFEEILRVNVVAGGLIVKLLNKQNLFQPAASLVFISSVASSYAAIGNIMYMSSKGGVNAMVRGLALELARKQIRINGVEPALIKTNLTSGISDEEIHEVMADYPLGRLGDVSDVAAAVQFLISDASSWMTGQFIRIDGGLTLK